MRLVGGGVGHALTKLIQLIAEIDRKTPVVLGGSKVKSYVTKTSSTACGFEEQLPTLSVVDNFTVLVPESDCELKITIFSGENFCCFDLERIEVGFA
ncbi:MAG: hypothetical protein ACYTXI_43340, partial [Nostoc sp.]